MSICVNSWDSGLVWKRGINGRKMTRLNFHGPKHACPCYTPIPHRPPITITQIAGGGGGGFNPEGGIHVVSFLKNSPSVMLRVSSDSDTMLLRIFGGNRLNSAGIAQEFITISKITLEHAARKLRNQLRIS